MRKIFMLTTFIIITVLALFFLVYYYQERLIFFPEKLEKDFEFDFDSNFTERNFEIKNGVTINALHFKTKNPKGVIYYHHGNAGSLAGWGEVGEYFLQYGYDALIYDFRGFGKSTGIKSESGFYKDAQFIYNVLKKEYEEKDIVLYGRSLGTGIAAYIASKNNPGSLILESPYYNYIELKKVHFSMIPSFVMRYSFPTNEYIIDIKGPVTLIHGTDDDLIHPDNSRKLKEIKPDADMYLIEGGHHNDLMGFDQYPEIMEKILIKK
ncbi:MAG: alpha/beta fold hydrolase [bacterium]